MPYKKENEWTTEESGFDFCQGEEFFLPQSVETGSQFPMQWVLRGWTTLLHLLPRSRIDGAVPPFCHTYSVYTA
jgi:hypothetical protein